MGKYVQLENAVFSIFDSATWKSENIKIYPSNFFAVNPGNEFIKMTIIPGSPGLNLISVSGQLILDIFTPAGNGPRRPTLIADKLDEYLSGKSITTPNGTVQFSSSNFSSSGVDADNASLYKSIYAIPFQFYGVF
jgi:hypothetical protein